MEKSRCLSSVVECCHKRATLFLPIGTHTSSCCVSGDGNVFSSCLLGLSGLLLHSRGSITGKRERESEREGSGEKDPASCSLHKMQRQSTEVSILLIIVPSGFQMTLKLLGMTEYGMKIPLANASCSV